MVGKCGARSVPTTCYHMLTKLRLGNLRQFRKAEGARDFVHRMSSLPTTVLPSPLPLTLPSSPSPLPLTSELPF